MDATLQTIVALGIVAVAVLLLARAWLQRKPEAGCGGNCSAVSPEVRKLRSKLKG